MPKISKKIIRYFYVLAFINLLLISSNKAQISFDVKTTFGEKSELRFYKLAIINSLQNSNWAAVKEVGENYSLWLTNLKRTKICDSVQVEFDLNVRTAAMFSRGKSLIEKHICVIYDTTGISKVSTSDDTLVTNLILLGLQKAKLYVQFINQFSTLIPYGTIIVPMFTNIFIKEIKRQPTTLEKVESNLLAAKVVVELNDIFNSNINNKKLPGLN